MNRFLTTLAVAAGFTVPVLAHHSPAALYDVTRTVTLEGTLADVEW